MPTKIAKCSLCGGVRPWVNPFVVTIISKGKEHSIKICNECASTLDVINTAVQDIDNKEKSNKDECI